MNRSALLRTLIPILSVGFTFASTASAQDSPPPVDIELGATMLVAEGGAVPALHAGLRIPLASSVDLEAKLETLGLATTLEGSFSFHLVHAEDGHLRLSLRQTQAGAVVADFFGGTIVGAAFGGGLSGTLWAGDAKISLGCDALVLGGIVLGRSSTRDFGPSEMTALGARPALTVELWGPAGLRPFVMGSVLVTRDFALGTVTAGLVW
jgi:hypothetical protein